MSKTWYPVINYEKCIECGACVDKCTHGVYDKEKIPRPVVLYSEGCEQGCKGCSSVCAVGAIEYFGDNQSGGNDECGCGGGCDCGGECDCHG